MSPLLALLFGGAGVAVASLGGAVGYTAHTARRIARAIPVDGHVRGIDGRLIHYREIGNGPPIVLIHGLAGQMRNFDAVVRLLAPDHRLILIDRPGSGHSPGRGADSLVDQAHLIARLLRQIGVEQAWVVGHSMGGAVALALALEHPDLTAGLVLVAPLTQVQEVVPAAFQGLMIGSPVARAVIARTLAIPIMRLKGARTRKALFAPEPVTPDFDITYGGAMLARPAAFFAASSEMVAVNETLAPLVARYPSVGVPVRILFGREDHVLDALVHGEATAAALPDGRCSLIAGGHMLPVTQPARVAAFIRDAAERDDAASPPLNMPQA